MEAQARLMAKRVRHGNKLPVHGQFFRLFLFVLVFFFFMGAHRAMANDSNISVGQPGAWWVTWPGGLEYGNSDAGFDGDHKFYSAQADTVDIDTLTGVGVFELNLQNADLEDARHAGELLCGKNIQISGIKQAEPAASFTVTCLNDGKAVTKYGSIQLISENIKGQIADAWTRLSDKAVKEGRKVIKLDYSTDKVEYKDGHFVISARFINSGNHQIKFRTPDQWTGTTVTDERLGIGSVAKIGENGKLEKSPDSAWGFPLSRQKILNRNEFPDGIVTLNSGKSITLKIQTDPVRKALKGEYEFSGVVFMHIICEGKWWNQSTFVDFRPIKTRIKIDRDYPSTLEERKQWEAKHRAKMSNWPVEPGEKFTENGLYRAVRWIDNASYRGLFLRVFRAGDIATTETTRMPMEQDVEFHINGPVQWVWEGEALQLIGPLYSSGYVEGTQHNCQPGETCPRSGRWVFRTRTPYLEYRYDLKRIITLHQGQPLPSANPDDHRSAEWEWVGPLT